MKWLIVSDSHGLIDELGQVLDRHKDEVDLIIHCGDSELNVEHEVINEVLIVRGNCDGENRFPNERIEEVGKEKLYITHGHHYNVKMSYVPISYRAEEVGATIVCFGHSHVATAFMENNIVYINPGSIYFPRQIREKTYAICEINDQEVSVTFYNIDGNVVETLAKTFNRM